MFKKRLTTLFLCLSFATTYGQKVSPQQLPIIEALKQIEANTSYRFNYDPDLLQQYNFKGQLDNEMPLASLAQLFEDTPLSFSVYEQKVLIFLAPKKKWRVCGYMIDQETNLPLPYTNVFGPDLKTGDQTDEQGFFDFSYVGYKNEGIQMSFIGYKTQEYRLASFDSLTCQSYVLKPDPSLFVHPVIITDYLIDGITEGESYSRVDLNYDQINNWYTNIEQDVLKMVQFIPGVTSINESAGDIQIRGSTVDQNLLLWEGATLYGPGHLFGSISSVNPFVVDQVKVYKGVFDPSYANRVGGIIDLSLSDEIPNNISGSVGTTLSEAHAQFNIPLVKEKLSFLVSGRQTTNQLFESPTLDRFSNKLFQNTKVPLLKEDGVGEEVLNYSDWNLKVNFRPTDKLQIKASFFNSTNDFNFSAPIGEDGNLFSRDVVDYQTQAFNTSISWNWAEDWTSNWSLNRSAYVNNYNFRISDPIDDQILEENFVFNSILDYAFIFKNIYQASDQTSIAFGYEYNFKEVNFDREYNSIFEETFSDRNLAEGNFHNAFAAYEYQTEKSQFNLGLRTIYYQETNKLAWSPRLNFQHQVKSSLKWKFSAGILHQYINQLKDFGDTELPLNNRVWVLNRTEGGETQIARKIATGLVFKQNGWLLDLEAYYHKTDGLNTLTPILQLDNDVTGIFTGSSSSKGVDFLLKKSWTPFNLWLNYSWSKVRFNFPDLLPEDFPGTNDLRHNLSLLGTYKWENWSFSMQYYYRSSLPYSEAIGVETFEDVEEEDIYYELEYSGINNRRLSDYQRMDIGINRYWDIGAQTKLELAFSVLNILDRDNLFSRDFFLDFDETETNPEFFEADKFLLARTPQILIRYSW